MNPEHIKVAEQSLSIRHSMDEARTNQGRAEMRVAVRKILREHSRRLNNPILCEAVEYSMDNLHPVSARITENNNPKPKEWPISKFEHEQAILVDALVQIRDNPSPSPNVNSTFAGIALKEAGF